MMAFNSLPSPPALELHDRLGVARIIARIILASGDINCGQHAIYGSGAGPGIRSGPCYISHNAAKCGEWSRDLSCGMPVKCLLCSDPGPGIKLLAENGSG